MNEKEAVARVEKYIKSFNGNALDCVAIGTVLTLLENKDKIIDLMAIAIDNEPLTIEEYCIFRNFDCPEVGGNRDCKECVKQYFENKVKEG